MRYQKPLTLGLGTCCFIVAAVASPIASFGRAVDDLRFPYQAIVVKDNAEVHSGPGKLHYSTQKLNRGDVVDVYREDPGGWCAIRPLEGSFSLVPETTLELVDERLGRITQDGTQAWVGTMLGPVEDPLWQVKLKKGELVTVMGQISWPDPDGHSTIWYQVSPPAGEFRWIRISDLQLPDTTKPTDESPLITGLLQVPEPDENTKTRPTQQFDSTVQAREQPTEQPPNANRQSNPIQLVGMQSDAPSRSTNPVAINGGWRQAKRPIAREPNQPRGRTPSNRMMVSEQNRGSYPSRDSTGSRFDSPYRVADADTTSPNFARDLNAAGARTQLNDSLLGIRPLSSNIKDLEMLLTNELLKEPAEWDLKKLENAAASISRNSRDPDERRFAGNYLDKIANCKTIQSGYRSNYQVNAIGSATRSQPIGTGTLPSPELSAELASMYDAHGWLAELKQAGGTTQPSYVLQNATGKITHHVLAAPGLNLQRYVKSRVGIMGVRGYHNRLKLDHVTAERVIVLEKPR